MIFKRFSRSRSNSQSYVDSHPSPHDSKANSASYDEARYLTADKNAETAYDDRRDLPSSRQTNTLPDDALGKEMSVTNMYRSSQTADVPPDSAASYGSRGANGYTNGGTYENAPSAGKDSYAAPDLLVQAFHQALRPHMDKVAGLESEITDLRAYIEQLEQQRSDVHAWIDKRGLRPDVPPSIASQMDTSSHATSPTHAAATLNAQLDRKITIVNFDLHRLQDDLNDSLPTPSFSACMLKFLPDIHRLSSLPSGPRYAFDLLLKLGGNLNSHGGLENGDEEDLAERRAFYARLDEVMVEVVRGRFKEEGDGWGVQKEVKRIEKTGAYLRNWGVEPYFPHTLDVMKAESSQSARPSSYGTQANSGAVAGATTPPNYS